MVRLSWSSLKVRTIAGCAAVSAAGGSAVYLSQSWTQKKTGTHTPRVGPGGKGEGLGLSWGVPWDPDWHKSGEEEELLGERRKRKSGIKRSIFLVRHGQYENEGQGDDSVRRLTRAGHAQAKLTGERLRDLVQAKAVPVASNGRVKLCSSGLLRARQTAGVMLDSGLPIDGEVEVDTRLNECRPCPYSPSAHEFIDSQIEASNAQVERAFADLFKPPSGPESEAIVVVGHANVIRYFVLRALQLPPEAWIRITLPNGSVTRIDIRGSGNVSLQCCGDAGHIPPNTITTRNV
eukprot:Hpha_TRINITY_DN15008_c2_g4::TRINITY_DN15008_c2_g4_i1::g.123844::m.123844/K15637/PGAM5; serine/threonine-protein phosphatase PGAM5